jgi:cysteine desulfurase
VDPIYLDYNATTPLHPQVAEAMRPFLAGYFANPASPHAPGRAVRAAIEEARARVAAAIGAHEDEIVFTSGGTESNNLAIRGGALANRERGSLLVTSAVEHPAVADVCDSLRGEGFHTVRVPVDRTGLVDPEEVRRAAAGGAVLITVMHANNEVGTVEPVREIAEVAHSAGALVHTDAAQSIGKVPARVDDLGVDLLSIAGHKVYGPKGIGALYVRRGVRVAPVLFGSAREGGRRPGTENVLGIVGLGKAMELVAREFADRVAHARLLRERLHAGLAARVPGLLRHGHPERALPNTLSVSFPGVTGPALLAEATGLAASAGAACHSGTVHVSATLAAMGVLPERAMGTVRFSTGMLLTEEQVDRSIELLVSTFARLSLPSGGEKRHN